MCQDAPDTSGMNRAAELNAELGEKALAWYQRIYDEGAPDREAAANTAREVSGAQIDAMRTATRLANEADAHNQQFRRAETAMLGDAMNFDTEAERERLAGIALGDVNEGFASAREQAERAITRTGATVNDGSYRGMQKQITLAQALAGASAKNTARQQARTMGHAMKMDALSLGRGLPAQQATQAATAINAGNSATGTAAVPVTLQQAAGAQMGQGFQTAIGANTASGNMYGQIAGIQSGAEAGNNSTMGSLASAAAMAFAI